ncbi:MAG: hypothetical protein Q7S26_00610 [bacterium]|nr:hypothetical protein [bacterium]
MDEAGKPRLDIRLFSSGYLIELINPSVAEDLMPQMAEVVLAQIRETHPDIEIIFSPPSFFKTNIGPAGPFIFEIKRIIAENFFEDVMEL